jgi:hypothetical protein
MLGCLNLLLPDTTTCLLTMSMLMVQRPVGMLCSEGGMADGRAGGRR